MLDNNSSMILKILYDYSTTQKNYDDDIKCKDLPGLTSLSIDEINKALDLLFSYDYISESTGIGNAPFRFTSIAITKDGIEYIKANIV